jgi:tRNA A-37 threonylcarbamoyl transferase component Bud32/HEPN domain-containing protein
MSDLPPDDDAPTRDLGRCLAIARQITLLPPHLHEAALRTACGGDEALLHQVRRILREPLRPEPASTPIQDDLTLPVPGQQFGRYLLHEVIGEGSMGIVHRATQVDTGRTVALKRLQPGPASDAVLQRFQREVALLARLQHPGIVQILDAGHCYRDSGREPYLAMELVHGPSLLEGVRKLGFDLRRKVRLLVQLCRAIAHAHRRGVIHRDLKPQNVLLDNESGEAQPRILDFGVATANQHHNQDATQAHHLVGTLGYIAPEQIDGVVDARCDLYSLGAIGYELLTGRRPLDLHGLSLLGAIARIRDHDPPPASRFDSRLAGDLDAILAKTLARTPNDRYASVDDLADDLERWLQHRPVEARPRTVRYLATRFVRRQPALAALAGISCLSTALGLFFSWFAFAKAHHANEELVEVLTAAVAELSAQTRGQARPQQLPATLAERVDRLRRALPDDHRVQHVHAEFLQLAGQLARANGRHQQALQARAELLAVRTRIVATDPSPTNRQQWALASILLGDLHKEAAEDQPLRLAEARHHYLAAHHELLQLQTDSPDDRRCNDDLAHSHLRLADLDFRHGFAAAANAHLAAASTLAEQLALSHRDHPYTHSLQRELLSLLAVQARHQGRDGDCVALLNRMLAHNLEAHRLDPEDLHVAIMLLSAARICARTALDHDNLEQAQRHLATAETAARLLAARDPHSMPAIEQRAALEELAAEFALQRGDVPDACRRLADAAELALRLRAGDQPRSLQARVHSIARLCSEALGQFEVASPELRRTAIPPARLLLSALAAMLAHRQNDPDLRILVTHLQVAVGSDREAAEARRTLQTAADDGWRDARLWLLVSLLLERQEEFQAALQHLAAPPADANANILALADAVRMRLRSSR